VARDLTSDFIAQLSAGRVQPCVFVFLDFKDDPAYLWSGVGNISWNGHTWLGAGSMGAISSVPETNEIEAQNVVLSLTANYGSLLSDCISAVRQDTAAQIWFGFVADDGSVVADPYQVFLGHLDVPTVTEGGDATTISVTCENPLVDLQRASNRRWTNDDQAIEYPTDTGFNFVASIQEWDGIWGKAGGGTASKSGGGSPPPPPHYQKIK